MRIARLQSIKCLRKNGPNAVGALGNLSCLELQTVSHVTHIQAAINIIRDGQIDARLVFDESRFNSSRTLVVWVSPNEWGDKGFFYGHVRFSLNEGARSK